MFRIKRSLELLTCYLLAWTFPPSLIHLYLNSVWCEVVPWCCADLCCWFYSEHHHGSLLSQILLRWVCARYCTCIARFHFGHCAYYSTFKMHWLIYCFLHSAQKRCVCFQQPWISGKMSHLPPHCETDGKPLEYTKHRLWDREIICHQKVIIYML